jgi:hypothetical protein
MMEATLDSTGSTGLLAHHNVGPSSMSSSKQAPHKRNRTQLSCTNCRQAKLKCDRQKPYCSQCEKKGRASLCSFPSPAARRKPTVSMQNRLKHLESLVKDVMTGQSPPMQHVDDTVHYRNGSSTTNGLNNSGVDQVPYHEKGTIATSSASSGQVLLGSNESTYVGATHWAAILEDVRLSYPI